MRVARVQGREVNGMEIHTTRFGTVGIKSDDVILFPSGILGLEDCQHWILLADAQNDNLGWLQSTTHGDVALAVVSPRRFVPDYDVRVPRSELEPLVLESFDEAHVLVTVSKTERNITVNLKAPLVINLRRRLGRQVVHNADEPLQYELCELEPARKIA
jgi:flagellar assembly factor FliW